MDVGSVYPLLDLEERLRALSPPVLRTEPAWSIVREIARGIGEVDQLQMEFALDLDPTLATDAALDACGGRVGERRGGLGDDEYRRIILGRTAAARAKGTVDGVWATWLALTGATEDRARCLALPVGPCVYLDAEVAAAPSIVFRRRLAAVLQDAVVYSYQITASVCLADGLRSGRSPGWDSGTFCFQIF